MIPRCTTWLPWSTTTPSDPTVQSSSDNLSVVQARLGPPATARVNTPWYPCDPLNAVSTPRKEHRNVQGCLNHVHVARRLRRRPQRWRGRSVRLVLMAATQLDGPLRDRRLRKRRAPSQSRRRVGGADG